MAEMTGTTEKTETAAMTGTAEMPGITAGAGVDRHESHSGYWPAPWPVECGGNRRQKALAGGLHAASGEARTVTRRNGRWNVMVVQRDPGQWYAGGTMPAFCGPEPFGWVERLDVDTLEPLAASPELPCGSHVWCGAILAHANGSIFSVNGSYLHRLDPDDLSVTGELRLPADRSHNGMLALSDGTLITKDLRLEGQGGTTITRVDPDTMELVHEPLVLVEGSMGRIAADVAYDSAHDGAEKVSGTAVERVGGGAAGRAVETLYVPGTEHLWRFVVEPHRLVLDDWRPRYRTVGGNQGLSWDTCLSDGYCWLMDCGDVASVRRIHTAHPNGRFAEPPGRSLSWRLAAPWTGAQRLLRVSLDDADDLCAVEPFGTPGGGIIAPPVYVPEHSVAVAWDSINGGLCGLHSNGGGLEPVWHLDVRPSMQPVVFPDTGELAINDFTDAGTDDIVVVDLAGGELIDRVDTGSRIGNGMFLTPDGNRGLFYCSTLALAHVSWR